MSPLARVLTFGSAFLAIVLGATLGPALGGVDGEAVAISLVSLGAIAIVSLVFLEVGLSEDRERAREDERRRQPPRPPRRARLPRRRRPG
jgi:hypothetical protein